MAGLGEEPPKEKGPVFADAFPADEPPTAFKRRLKEIGRRRKRFLAPTGSGAAVPIVVLVGGVLTAVAAGVLAFLLPTPPAVRVALGALALVLLAAGVAVAWALRSARARRRAEDGPAFDFHERGCVYRDGRRVVVFGWGIVGKVVFAPDSTPGRKSELIISLAPEGPIISGQSFSAELLRNALVIDSDLFPLEELHAMARRMRNVLGDYRVVSRPRDDKLYRVD